MEKENKSNVCGIVGLCIGWSMPLVGIILGIIALAKKEPTKALGILSIIESVIFWIIWASIFSALNIGFVKMN